MSKKKLINSYKWIEKGSVCNLDDEDDPTFTIASRALEQGLQEGPVIGLQGCPAATDG